MVVILNVERMNKARNWYELKFFVYRIANLAMKSKVVSMSQKYKVVIISLL